MERYTLSANERIKNSKEITTLIREGQAFFLSPFKVYYQLTASSGAIPVRAAFAVPKRKFSKAVMRNRLKRLSREAFRLQKIRLSSLRIEKDMQLNVLFMYQRTAAHNFEDINQSMVQCIDQIIKENG